MNKNSDNSNNKRIYFSEAQLSDAIEKHKKEASEFIKDEDKFEKLIQKLEKTLKKCRH